MNVGFIGTGEIGGPVAGHIAEAGHELVVHNRTRSKAEAVPGAVVVDSAIEAAAHGDVLVTCVGDDADLSTLFLSEGGIADAIRPGSIVIDHTTASATVARRIAGLLGAKGAKFVDAPVSGGTAGAKAGKLSVMVGGDPADVDQVRPLLELYSGRIAHVGPVGAGQLTKAVNQVCIAGILQGLAEGLALAKAAGLDIERVLDAIGAGAAGSWQMENRASFMTKQDYPAGFAASLMHKDLRISLDEAAEMRVPMPVAALVLQQYSKLLGDGQGHEDFSNLHRLVAK